MRALLKWVGIILLIPIVLVLFISVLLYLPPVQNFVINKAVGYANQATGFDISVNRIRISFPLKLALDGVRVISPPADTLLTASKLTAHIKPFPLLKKEVIFHAFDIENVTLNTDTLIDGMHAVGQFTSLHLETPNVNLNEQHVVVNAVDLKDALINLTLTEAKEKTDTASTPLKWLIDIDKINFERVSFNMQMPASNLQLASYLDKTELSNGKIDLATSRYTMDDFTISNTNLKYDGNNLQPAQGFDPMHIALNDLNLRVSSIVYSNNEMNAEINEFNVKERSGLTITSMTGKVHSDSTTIEIPELALRTTDSQLNLLATIPWGAINSKEPHGNIRARLSGTIGKNDILKIASQLPADIRNAYPNQPLSITAGINGNTNAIYIQQLKAELPGAFLLNASGNIRQLTDSINRSGEIKLTAETRNLNFVNDLLPDSIRNRIRIPSGIRLSGEAAMARQEISTRMLITESQGRVQVNGRYNLSSQAYQANLNINNLEPIHFLPQDSLMLVTASIRARGRGTDFFSRSTRSVIQGDIQEIKYASTELHDVNITANLQQGELRAEVHSEDPYADLDMEFNGTLQQNYLQGILSADITNLNFYQLHLLNDTISTSLQMYAEGESDLKNDHLIDLTIGNWEIVTPQTRYRPKLVTLHANTDIDTTRVSLHSGDLGVYMTGNAGLQSMIDQFSQISTEINNELQQDTMLYITRLRPLFPDMDLAISAGKDNPAYTYLSATNNIRFDTLVVNASTSPDAGLQLDAGLYGLIRDTLRIDTIQFAIQQDTAGLMYDLEVAKKRYRQQRPFTAGVAGHITDTYVDAGIEYRNEKDSVAFLIGARANKVAGGINITLFPEDVILFYRDFSLNPDNYVLYRSQTDIEANLRLTGENNASIWVHSSPEKGTMEQLFAEISQIDLSDVSDAIPSIPPLGGILNASIQYEPSDSSFLVMGDINIDTLRYDGGYVGEIILNATYVPLSNGQQQIDLHMFRDQTEALTANALYRNGDPDEISGNITFNAFPMNMVSPFIPDDLASLSGALNGEMALTGTTQAPNLNGYLQMDTAGIFLTPAGMNFRIDDKRITVSESLITFDEWKIYGSGDNPFVIDGTVNIGNISRITADLTLNANNMELLNSERTSESMVYGRLLVDLNSSIKGPVNALSIQGDLHLLGGTDVTYVLTDSPLTVQDRLDGLVTFVSFADTVDFGRDRTPRQPAGGMDMRISIVIDQSVQLNVDLTPDQSNHVSVTGGGDLTFQSTPQGDLVMNGQYTISEGTIAYTLPVVPLRDFSVHEGSSIQFNGDVMNPTVNVTATERVRTSVTTDADSGSRLVNFDVGIVVTGNLEDLNLQFILDAPEDQEIQNQLASMGPEEEAKQAVGMLVTGRYLAGASSGGTNFDMGSALNAFLQNEIGNIAGDALKSVDISFDVDTYNDGGENRTDYNFRFAKRFYNDRIQVVIGGRVSSGDDLNMSDTQSFIDDVSFEYRLDNSGTRFVRLFHEKNYESILEGEITETGIGLVLRKKMRYLKELFMFRRNRNKPVAEDTEDENNTEVVYYSK